MPDRRACRTRGTWRCPNSGKTCRPGCTRRAKRQYWRSRQKVIERFFFDRVDANATGAAIGGQHHPIALARTHEAERTLAFMQPAEAGTEIALNSAIGEFVPISAKMTGEHFRHGSASGSMRANSDTFGRRRFERDQFRGELFRISYATIRWLELSALPTHRTSTSSKDTSP